MKPKSVRSFRSSHFAIGSAIFLCLSAGQLQAQAVIQWSTATGSAWLDTANWTGAAVPGTADVAQFAANPTSGTTGVGINMNGITNNGTNSQAAGAIEVTNSRNSLNLIVGNSSTTIGGTLTLNGANINSVPNTMLRNNGGGSTTLTLQNTQGTGNKTMAVVFNNAAPVVDAVGGVTISSILTSANGFTKTGTGTFILSGSANTIGPVAINAGRLQLGNTGALGGTGAVTAATGGELRVQSGGTFTTTRALTISGTGVGGVGAITAGGSTLVNLNGGITLAADSAIKGDGGCAFNTIVGSDITGTNTNLTVTLDGSTVSTFNGNLSLGTGGLTKGGTSSLNLNGTVAYSGPTLVTGGVLAIGGATTNLLSSSSLTAQAGTLSLVNTAGNADRLTDSQALALVSGGGLSLTGNATADTTETIGAVNLTHSGTLTVTSATDRITSLAIASLNRSTSKATALVRGTNLDQIAATNVARITLADGGTSLGSLVGTTTLNNAPIDDAAKDVRIIPWMVGDSTPAGTGSGFVTYDSALGLRVLSTAQAVELTAPYATALNPENAVVSLGSLILDNASGITVNSLMFKTAASTLDSLGLNPLTISSGALATSGNFAFDIGAGFSGLVFGNDEGMINVATNTLTINTPISVSAGGGLVKSGGGTLALTAANTYSGKTFLNTGTLSFSSIADVGAGASALGAPTTAAAGVIEAFSGNLTYTGAGHASDRGINLQALTTGTTISLFNSGTGDLTLSGPITGLGTLFVRGSGANITLSGLISHDGGVTHTEDRTLFLTNPANSFTGALTASKGVVSIASIANSGVNSPIGAGSTITMGQSGFNNTGTLQFTGASGGSSNRPINIQSNTGNTNGGIIENTVAGQTLTLSGGITTGGSGTTPTLVLTGPGDGALTGSISGTGLSITKNGVGTWVINGAHTFTGATNVSEGLLHFGGTTRTLNGTTLGGGPAGTTATLATAADTINLGGNVTYNATNNPNGAIIAAGTLNLTGTRTFTVGNSTAADSDLTVNSLITGSGGLTKAGAGLLTLPTANTFTGNLQITGTAFSNTLRIEHSEALGPVGVAKTVTATGSNRQVSILELANNITIDATKTFNTAGKSYLAMEDSNSGSPVFLRNASGNNTWLGDVIINAGGGSYAIESGGGTLTLGADPSTTSVIRNDVTASTRSIFFRGPGNIVVNHRFVPNGTGLTGLAMHGTGTLTINRTDNDFANIPGLAAGTTVIESLANSGIPSSLGTGTGVNFGGTLRHVGSANSSSARAIQFIGTSPTLESSGTGTLSMTSGTTVTYNTGGGSTAAPFDAGSTTLTLTDVWSLMPGMGIAGRGIDAGTLITAVDYDARQLTIDKPTTLTTLGGRVLATTAASAIGATSLTISVANASLPNLFVGMNVSATGIPANTAITNIDTATGVITLDKALTAAIASGVNINFNSNAMTVSGGNTVNRTFTLGGTNTGDNTFAPPLVNPSAAVLSVVKANAGKWILTGTSTYTGTTSVNQGTLLVNGTHSAVSTYTVASGATLGGTGSIASAVTVNGTLAPGASIEDLATGALTFGNNSTLAIEIDTSSGSADKLIVTGNVVTGGNTVNLTLTDLGGNVALPIGTKLTLVDYSGVWDDTDIVHFNGNPVPSGSNITLGANTFTVDYSDGSDMTLTAAIGTANPFQDWVSKPIFGLPVADQDPTDDPDKDGRDNLLEFALDGNPADGSNNGKMVVKTDDSGDAGTDRDLTLTLAVRNGATLGSGPGGSATLTVDGIIYTISGSATLQAWDKAVSEVTPAFTLTPAPNTGWTTRTFQVGDSNTLPGKRFIRVGVSQ